VPFRTDVYVVDDQLIWGATARILADLLERVHAELG
jgi:adenine/guanine phosphoribosyltransferase-like PRPP-binding protein